MARIYFIAVAIMCNDLLVNYLDWVLQEQRKLEIHR